MAAERIRLLPVRRRVCWELDLQPRGRNALKAYVEVGYYMDGDPGEIWLSVNRVGSDLRVTYDAWAIGASYSLQHGVPLAQIARALRGVQDDFAGTITSPDELAGRPASSLWDAVGQVLEVA